MSNSFSSPTSDERDEYPKVTQAELERAKFRIGLKPAPRKQRVTILLDTGLIEYFKAKAKASGRGYLTLINDTLRREKENESLEEILRRVIHEELHRDARSDSA
ncbi:MAG: BrnA antitoxin family protein [Methylococcales bacterium]